MNRSTGSLSLPPSTTGLASRAIRWSEEVSAGLLDALFRGPGELLSSYQVWFGRGWLTALYVFGLIVWAFFLNFGRIDWGVQDWIWEYRYTRVLEQAMATGRLPLHIEPALVYGLNRFLAIPDVPLAPQILALRYLDQGTSFLINLLVMFTVGYTGCLLLRRHFQLSLVAFTVLTVLVSFNGFITAHLGIGHTFFTGYFYFPLLIYLVLRFLEAEVSRVWPVWVGLVLFGMELQGSMHMLAFSLLFLALVAVFDARARAKVAAGIGVGLVFNLYRIAPAALALAPNVTTPYPGYVSVGDLLHSMIVLVPPSAAQRGLPIGWWELDLYVGVVGVLVLAFFGIYKTWWRPSQETARFRPLGYVLLILVTISIGYFYMPAQWPSLPLLRLLHVPSRFMAVPLLVVAALAAVEMQRWFRAYDFGNRLRAVFLLLMAYLIHDLVAHARIWRVALVGQAFPSVPYEAAYQIVSLEDPLYVGVLAISSLVSLGGLLVAIGVILKARPRRNDGKGK